jgi:hypothetical protein
VDESRTRVLVGGLALAGALFLLDAVYFPLLLAGPPVTGVVVGLRGGRRETAVGLWVVAGLAVLVYDAVVNREDVVFHLVVTAFTALVAWGAWAVASRRRRVAV